MLRVGACQTPELPGDVPGALAVVKSFAARAPEVDLLLFPECFLQGYLVSADHLARTAFDLRAERVRETGLWLISADVTGQRDDQRIGLGPTSVISPDAAVVAQVPRHTVGMVTAEISPSAGRPAPRRSAPARA